MNTSSHEVQAPFASTIAWALAFGAISLVIIIGNSLAILVLTRKKLLRKRTSYFLLSLAVADMAVGIFSVPTFIYQLICFWKGVSISNSTILKIVKSIDVFCGLASTFTLTVIALERFCAICLPLSHRTATRKLYNVSISCVWILAALLSSLYFFHEYNLIPHEIFFWFLIFTFFASVLLMLLAYAAIWWKVCKTQVYLKKASLEMSDTNEDDRPKRFFSTQRGKARGRKRPTESERKLVVTVFIVTTVFILSWLPFHVVNLIVFLECKTFPCSAQPSSGVVYFCKLLHYTNSLLNPVIYSLRLRDFRRTLKKIISSSKVH